MAHGDFEAGVDDFAHAGYDRENAPSRYTRSSVRPNASGYSSPICPDCVACSVTAVASSQTYGAFLSGGTVRSAERSRYNTSRLLDSKAATRDGRWPLLSDCAGVDPSDTREQHPYHNCYFEATESARPFAQQFVSWSFRGWVRRALWKQLFWWFLTPLLFLFLWLVWSAATSFYFSEQGLLDYGIVIDAGSHGSRVTVFSWKARRFDPRHPLTGPVTIPQPVCGGNSAPALSSFADDFPGARKAFKSMLDECQVCLARRGVPTSVWGEIPLFVKATGGMRNLSQGTRDALMASLRTALEDPSVNPFKFDPSWARVISGEEEGFYGWLAVNSACGSLSDDPEKTVGALDMGGASMQITFSPLHTSVLEDFIGVHLGNKSIRLYSHSFLGYGWSDALNRVSTMLGVEALVERLREDPDFIEKAASKPIILSRRTSLYPSLDSEQQRSGEVHAGTSGANRPEIRGKKQGQRRLSEKENGERTEITLASVHPCLPRGSVRSFQMPSLAYPERRFYADIDTDKITTFMKAAAYAKNDILKTIKSMAPYGVKMRHSLQDMQPLSNGSSDTALLDFNVNVPDSGTATGEHLDQKVALTSDDVPRDRERETGGEALASPAPGDKAGADGSKGSRSSRHSRGNDQEDENERKKERGKSKGGAEGPIDEEEQNTPNDGFGTGKQGGVEVTLDVKPKATVVVRFVGSGNFKACRERAYKLFHNSLCFINSCSFNGVYQPRLEDSKFIAFGQFSKVHAALGLVNPTSLSEFLTATTAVCGLRLKRLKGMRRRGFFRAFADISLQKLCWKAIWSFAVLRQGFGFPLESSQISFASVNSASSESSCVAPGWTLGSMISEVNFFPWQAAVEQYHGLFLLAAAFLLMCIILAMVLYHEVSFLRKRLEHAERAAVHDSVIGTPCPPTSVSCPMHLAESAPA
ncbi:GDA1/CD39 (nucleoside phosphatase) family protein [Toxoplasma gondii TgCatPRC2]|uniref:GDA1/CD39 (Nucleoside phosphatase) family protein n=1 Tax=Toxoplasma gondii TgCatPRC2 TaxID=1130821 RepID=A0A151GZJ7_TOXGO|nr:GDA1/CD39 (nucleoside phosphatase) family protein [Toxoplasma gondii TgCatPRC2]